MQMYGDILQLSLFKPSNDTQSIMAHPWPLKNANVQTCIDKVK